jgi:hypothetical protein
LKLYECKSPSRARANVSIDDYPSKWIPLPWAVTVDLSGSMCARANSLMVSMRPQCDEITQQILYKAIFRDLAGLPRFLLDLAE